MENRSKNSALKCFVAMAVGQPDTDRIYDKHILPTLRAANIHSTFICRLEHNDDIDKRIIQEIEACDFAIADLTYARPTVYFEAGFAQRKVPVIYTCRKDHLRPQANESLRVHFDLLMRNIIRWSGLGDRMFAPRLARRVALVTRPLLRRRQEEAAEKAEEREVERIALTSRLSLVSEKFRHLLGRHGYRTVAMEDRTTPFLSRRLGAWAWVGRLPKRDTLSLCSLHVRPKFSQRDIRSYEEAILFVLRSPIYMNLARTETEGVKKLVARIILCSLEKTPLSRLISVLARYRADEAGKVFQWDGDLPVSSVFYTVEGLRTLPISVSVYMFDPIRSQRDVQARSLELRHALR